MNLRREFEKLIEKKKVEIIEHEKMIAAAEAYIQAMGDALKKVPKDDGSSPPPVRPGSDVEKIREAILLAGEPLHLNQIIAALGRPDDAETKAKVAGTLSWYIGKGRVFTKTAPNTYGLVDPGASRDVDLPADFGSVTVTDNSSEVRRTITEYGEVESLGQHLLTTASKKRRLLLSFLEAASFSIENDKFVITFPPDQDFAHQNLMRENNLNFLREALSETSNLSLELRIERSKQ